MAVPPKKMREIVFQLLYSRDLGEADSADMLNLLVKELEVTRSTVREAQAKVEQLQAQRETIDAAIAATAKSYSFERIPHVERNILRLAAFELMNDKEIPPKVVISEAIRLARKFATPESSSFINAVLDAMYKDMIGEKAIPQAIEETIEQLEKEESPPPPEEHAE